MPNIWSKAEYQEAKKFLLSSENTKEKMRKNNLLEWERLCDLGEKIYRQSVWSMGGGGAEHPFRDGFFMDEKKPLSSELAKELRGRAFDKSVLRQKTRTGWTYEED